MEASLYTYYLSDAVFLVGLESEILNCSKPSSMPCSTLSGCFFLDGKPLHPLPPYG